ncbi:MAG TPA: histidine phosphatase family protein, partial [Pyrinomonadaceae bacterium]
IRHGQSQGNAEGRFGGHTATPLSPRGRKQAEATAHVLASEKINAIYSSDLPRAIETALPLARLTGLEIERTSAFRERSVGVMEGLTFEEAAGQHPEQYAALIRRDMEHVCLAARVTGKCSTAPPLVLIVLSSDTATGGSPSFPTQGQSVSSRFI